MISIHAPREGGDYKSVRGRTCTDKFQSTPPARGATADLQNLKDRCNISIHAPREGGDDFKYKSDLSLSISIHAPREGGDSSLNG